MTRLTNRRIRPIHACSLLLGLATALPPVIAPFAACAQTAEVMTPTQRAAALAGAQGVVARFAQIKSIKDMADLLTNKSAGEMGLVMTMMIGMMVGLSSLGEDAASKTTGAKATNPLKADYDAFALRYGLNDTQVDAKGHDLPPAITRDGRQFLLDALALMDKMGDKKDQDAAVTEKPFRVSEVAYQVISPTDVRLTLKSQPGQPAEPPLHAVQENGQWRLDMGDLSSMMKSSSGDTASAQPSRQEQSFLDAAQRGNFASVKKMLARHPKLALAHDTFGKTALFAAVFDDNLPMAKSLLAAGANVNARDMSGATPLDDALFFHKDDAALLALLRRHGATKGK